MSAWRPITFRCSSSMPPCPWTIGFGRPVVPDEYRTYSGCSVGNLDEPDRCHLRHQRRPRDDVGRHGRIGVRHDDGMAQARQSGPDRGQLVDACHRVPPVPVALHGQQHGRLDLGEAVEHRLHAELGRARRPDRAEAARRRGTRRSSRGCSAGRRRRGRPRPPPTVAVRRRRAPTCSTSSPHVELDAVSRSAIRPTTATSSGRPAPARSACSA